MSRRGTAGTAWPRAAVAALLLASGARAAELRGIDFRQEGEVSLVEFRFDSEDVEAERFHIREDRQIVVDFKAASADAKTLRAFDTSEFDGPVVFVSAYSRPGGSGTVRAVVQLRDNVRSELEQRGGVVVLRVENRFGAFGEEAPAAVAEGAGAPGAGTAGTGAGAAVVHVPRSSNVEDILENLTLSGPKRYIGKKISLDIRNVPFQNVLKIIADNSGFSIVLTESAKQAPPLTLSVVNIPWDQLLDMILDLNNLVGERSGSILVIHTLEALSQRRQALADQQRNVETVTPLETRIIPVSYSQTESMREIIAPYMTEGRGSIAEDSRTNSLIIKDTPEALERMAAMIRTLDTQVPQILIESKIVEVSESYARTIGLNNGINTGYDPIGLAGVRPVAGAAGGTSPPTNAGPGFTFSSAPVVGSEGQEGGVAAGLTIATLGRLRNLNFQLQLMESESKGKVVASPKVITQNNQAASISSTQTTSYVVSTTGDGGTTQSYESVDSSLNMTVTPKVTNDGSIGMVVDISKSSFGGRPSPNAPPDTTQRSVRTNVLVDNGSTIVIGGLYNYETSDAHSGIPFLKDLPLVGWLFRTAWSPSVQKSEMMVFLTPRVINEKEALLAGVGD